MDKQVGKWAFIIGAVIAIIVGIAEGAGVALSAATMSWITVVLVLAGLVVGIVNISAKEVSGFLIASIAVLAAGTAGLAALVPGALQLGAILAGIVAKLIVVIAPAALIVALRAVYGFAAE